MSELATLEQHIPALRRYAWALLRNRSDADDLVQSTLLRALDRLATRTADGDMRPWLFTIMHNLHVSRWRSLRFRATVVLNDQEADLAVAPSQHATAELREAFEALDKLPDDQRQVLLLVAVEGFEYAEAAAILGVPVGTVMSRLSRARDRLRDNSEGRSRPMLRRVK
jgi:RNA polymerase sigma-70 factor (ECF subfamily)